MQDALSLGLRWAHIITAIVWIGTSFFFVMLDASLAASDDREVEGEAWLVHSGGFYNVTKYEVAPARLPPHLHWFKWEAAWTLITGMALLVLLYWVGVDGSLLPAASSLTRVEAIGIAAAALVGPWAVYELVWRLEAAARHPAVFNVLTFAALIALSAALTEVFNPRAAFIHLGALIGLCMVANVWIVIIPGQQRIVAALVAGETPDPAPAIRAKHRSMHNSYATLPVIFTMISAHYPLIIAHRWSWIVVAVLFVIGAAARHWFIQRHLSGRGSPWIPIGVAAAAAALYFVVRPVPIEAPAGAPEVSFLEAREIVDRHCLSCHARVPTQPGFAVAPKGVAFDTAAEIGRYAAQIQAQAVTTHLMPLGNLTQMSPEERERLGLWVAQGARIE